MKDVLRSARRTSLMLQMGLFSSQLEVITAPVKDSSKDFYGMSVFGIDRITGTYRKILMDAKPIIYKELQSFFA